MVLSAAPVVISKGSLRVNADDGLRSDSDDEPIVRPSTAAPGARATVVTTSTTENDDAEKPSSAPSSTAAAAPVAFHLLEGAPIDARTLQVVFIGLAALTVPHMMLIEPLRLRGWRA